jgi:hypothetical protein
MKIRLLLPLLIASLGTAQAVSPPTAFIAYPSLAKTGYSAPGGTDITFSTIGLAAINPSDEVIFENRLIGSGSSLGRSRALFAYRGTTTDLTLFAGTSFGLGLPSGTKFTSFLSPIHNRSTSTAVFQATISGPGISSSNNRVILQDNNGSPTVITRTGVPFPSLGNASPSSFLEVLQQEGANDRLAIVYKLKASTTSTPPTKSNNDSGLLLMTHAGAVTHSSAREGSSTFVSPGGLPPDIFGQFNRAAILNGNAVAFTSKVIPLIGKPVDSLFLTGAVSSRSNLTQGTTPPALTAGELLGTFTGVGRIDSAVALLRTTLTKSPSSTNEAVWNSGGTLLLRKGQDIGADIKITKILRVWGINNGQLLAHVQLSNKATALILRQTPIGNFFTLISTRTQAPSFISGVDVATIQAIDVDPVNGHYVVLGSLKGLAANENQALWTGQTTLGTDMAPQARLPILQLQKGSVFVSTNTPLNLIRSISIRPAVDPTGVGARGFGQQINPSGATLVTLTGDRGIKELVLLNPSPVMGVIFMPR